MELNVHQDAFYIFNVTNIPNVSVDIFSDRIMAVSKVHTRCYSFTLNSENLFRQWKYQNTKQKSAIMANRKYNFVLLKS